LRWKSVVPMRSTTRYRMNPLFFSFIIHSPTKLWKSCSAISSAPTCEYPVPGT
jgi:hypothetical protein